MSSENSQHLGDELLGGEEDDIVEREPDGKEAAKEASTAVQTKKGNARLKVYADPWT
jgi:hypothetical protein